MKDIKKGQTPKVNLNPDKSSRPSQFNVALQKPSKIKENLDKYIVGQDEVKKAFLKHQVNLMIHGHTHRPNIHKSIHNGNEYKRIVLGDWYRNSFILNYQKDRILIEKTSFASQSDHSF